MSDYIYYHGLLKHYFIYSPQKAWAVSYLMPLLWITVLKAQHCLTLFHNNEKIGNDLSAQ